jgi:hypothetical protein
LVGAGVARAATETGSLPNNAHITFEKLLINEDGGEAKEPRDPETLRRYLNLAHCTCSKAEAGDEQFINYQVRLSPDTGTDRPGDVFVGGPSCQDDLLRPTQCRGINTIADIDQMVLRPDNLQFTLFDAVNVNDTTGACRETEGDVSVWILVDSDANGSYDYTVKQVVGETAQVKGPDTLPPPLPTEIEASSAESSIVLSWTPPTTRPADIAFYQALCATGDAPALPSPSNKAQYQTVRSLCGLEQDIPLSESVITTGDEDSMVTLETLPPGLAELDPAFICGQASATAAGMSIKGLENGVPYTIVLLTVDLYGNVSGTFLSETVTPEPATDFWEDLHDRGSDVEGGFCLLAETYGDGSGLTQTLRAFRDETLASTVFGRALIDAYYGTLGKLGFIVHGSLALKIVAAIVLAPLVAIALLWHTLTLPGLLALVALAVMWKRRRRYLAAALAFLIPSIASAQGPTPYWDEESQAVDQETEGLVKWHVGIRIGPYTPNIDDQLGMDPGPYEQMFGGSQWLPMLDVDRILWRGFGQLGIGGSIGYMQKTANAWLDGSSPDDPMRPRSPGNENTFRLMPLVLSGVYRFTWLDDEFGIPIVPYVRGGIGYYLWWITTNGDTSETCFDGTTNPDCDADKAIGASFGIVGSVGLAIRAERIDKAAANSMRASGIQHAGFYVEWSVGKVDGFRPETKLSVGDSTWFAGANFEF